jgi:hypothetical protein
VPQEGAAAGRRICLWRNLFVPTTSAVENEKNDSMTQGMKTSIGAMKITSKGKRVDSLNRWHQCLVFLPIKPWSGIFPPSTELAPKSSSATNR